MRINKCQRSPCLASGLSVPRWAWACLSLVWLLLACWQSSSGGSGKKKCPSTGPLTHDSASCSRKRMGTSYTTMRDIWWTGSWSSNPHFGSITMTTSISGEQTHVGRWPLEQFLASPLNRTQFNICHSSRVLRRMSSFIIRSSHVRFGDLPGFRDLVQLSSHFFCVGVL